MDELDDHQAGVVAALVEASRRGNEERRSVRYLRSFQDEKLRVNHPGLRETLVLVMGDVEELVAAGVVTHRSISAGGGSIELTDAAYDAYANLKKAVRSSAPSPVGGSATYVDLSRLDQLRQLTSPEWDMSRLVRLCEELNLAVQNDMNHATAMLVRAIMDHVPPIFGVTTFDQIVNNYPGAKSFKNNRYARGCTQDRGCASPLTDSKNRDAPHAGSS